MAQVATNRFDAIEIGNLLTVKVLLLFQCPEVVAGKQKIDQNRENATSLGLAALEGSKLDFMANDLLGGWSTKVRKPTIPTKQRQESLNQNSISGLTIGNYYCDQRRRHCRKVDMELERLVKLSKPQRKLRRNWKRQQLNYIDPNSARVLEVEAEETEDQSHPCLLSLGQRALPPSRPMTSLKRSWATPVLWPSVIQVLDHIVWPIMDFNGPFSHASRADFHFLLDERSAPLVMSHFRRSIIRSLRCRLWGCSSTRGEAPVAYPLCSLRIEPSCSSTKSTPDTFRYHHSSTQKEKQRKRIQSDQVKPPFSLNDRPILRLGELLSHKLGKTRSRAMLLCDHGKANPRCSFSGRVITDRVPINGIRDGIQRVYFFPAENFLCVTVD
ncbi:hypothetical protein STAS_15517 [Striga asiatica]|uniref:Uncharacterized protein n=1 Tax=Striga asiatica TaxID=4170 RepID=A0A5A7Q3N4_STRAF|nr:hypothetical protein STAS_15517 [Striga asiatica]